VDKSQGIQRPGGDLRRQAPWKPQTTPTSRLAASVLYSLVSTCHCLEVNPFEYLRDVIDRVSTQQHSRIAELLPRDWPACP
jgi:hypothetical protein